MGITLCLGLQVTGVLAETKSANLKQYLPQVDVRLGGVYGPTDLDDRTVDLARSILPPGNIVSLDKVVKAIVIKNPDAFSAGNSKKLKVGVLLKLPTLEEVQDSLGQKKAEANKLQSLQSDNESLKKENAALLLKLQAQSNGTTVTSSMAEVSDGAVTQDIIDPTTVILGSILVPVSTSEPTVIGKVVKASPLNKAIELTGPAAVGSKQISPVSSLLTEEGN